MAQVTADLGASSVVGHELDFERVLSTALDYGSSGYWAELGIAWLEAGFPATGYRDELRRAAGDRRVAQRARQAAGRILAREFPEAEPGSP